jgi:hypothetical protein
VTKPPPVIEIRGVVKVYGGREPLRLRHLRVDRTDQVVLLGPEASAVM